MAPGPFLLRSFRSYDQQTCFVMLVTLVLAFALFQGRQDYVQAVGRGLDSFQMWIAETPMVVDG